MSRIENIFAYIRTHKFSAEVIELAIGLCLSLLSMLVFIRIAHEVLEKEVLAFDVSVSKAIYHIRTPQLTRLMIFATNFGAEIIIVASVLIIIAFLIKKHYEDALFFSLVLLASVLLNFLLKNWFHVARPHIAQLIQETSYSFPSGHAMNSFIFYSLVAYFICKLIKNTFIRVLVIIFAAFFILLIGFSRVYLGVHYPSDVIAGYIAGFWIFITAIFLNRSFKFYFEYKEKG